MTVTYLERTFINSHKFTTALGCVVRRRRIGNGIFFREDIVLSVEEKGEKDDESQDRLGRSEAPA